MHEPTARQHYLGVLARSAEHELDAQLAWLKRSLSSVQRDVPRPVFLRKPETGMVMVRGRIGGNGAQFNFGEATLTRCTVRLPSGKVGVGYVRGTSARHAEMVALCDAMLQESDLSQQVVSDVIEPLQAAQRQRHDRRAAEVAASRVDFFTLVRGED